MLLEILKGPKEIIDDFISVAELLSLVDRPLKDALKWEDIELKDIPLIELASDEVMENTELKRELEDAIKDLPLREIIDPDGGRKEAFGKVLRRIVADFRSDESLQTSRTITLLLLMFAFAIGKGEISPARFSLINDFRWGFEVEDDVFGDLYERAALLHKELSLTLTILAE